MKPYYSRDGIVIYNCDCRDVLPTLAKGSVDMVLTDPPYSGVKREAWDNQWKTSEAYISWIGEQCEQWYRLLKANGSLYVFASPQMAARIECKIAEWFNILNRIRWLKSDGWHKKASSQSLRSYLSPWEEIIFAEHNHADDLRTDCDDALRGQVFEPIRLYLRNEWRRAGLKQEQANEACGTASMAARHYFAKSQWCLPTAEHYEALRSYANKHNGGGEYLRREYEDLRREFNVITADDAIDVWHFPTVQPRPNKHPCEKPLAMVSHILKISSRPSDLILDPFMGSGTTLVAAQSLGRRAIGIEVEEKYVNIAIERLQQIPLPLIDTASRDIIRPTQGGLFDGSPTDRRNEAQDFSSKQGPSSLR